MDVVSSVGAIVGLVFNFAKAIKCCHDIKGKYHEVDETIASVKDELETLQGALKQLMALMMNDLDALSSQWDEERHLPMIFAGAMKGFDRTIGVLMEDLKGLHSKVRDGGSEMGKRKKAKFMWNESGLNGHCVQLRSQAGALQLLLGILQTGSLSDFKKDLKDLKALIENLAIMSPPSIPDEPPMYTPKSGPTFHLLDFSDDLMDIEKVYPAHMDSSPTLHSEHGELLRWEMTPNSTGESSKSGSKTTVNKEIAGSESTHLVSPVMCSYYLPEKFDEFRPLPKMPLTFRSTSTRTRRLRQFSNDPPVTSNDILIPPPEEKPSTRPKTIEELDAEDLKAVDLLNLSPSPSPKPKGKPPPRSNLEDLGIIHPSPSPSPKSKPRQKLNHLSSIKSTSPPEVRAISKRLIKMRLASSSPSQASSLFLAISANDLPTFSHLLKSGDDIESPHPATKFTPLIHAASLGHFSMLELLLTANANLNAVDSSSRTALHHAASSNSPECTELLLAHGADPNSKDHEKDTPLHKAVHYLRSESVEILLGWTKEPLKLKNLREQTALHLAARNRGLNIISKLCEGAKRTEHVSSCSISEMSECGCPVLYDGVGTEDVAGETALQFALRHRSMEAISLLLKYTPNGANAPQRVRAWSSQSLEACEVIAWERPLHYAMRQSSKTLAKRLLDAGADVELLSSKGKTAFEVAVERGNWSGVRSLLGGGGGKVVLWVVTKLTDDEFKHLYSVNGKHEYTALEKAVLDKAIGGGKWGKVCIMLEGLSYTASEKEEIAKMLDYGYALPGVVWHCEKGLRAKYAKTLLEFGLDVNVRRNGV